MSTDSVKESNPKDAVGIKKVPFSTVPTPIIAEIGLAMLEGACKYGRHNYRAIGVRTSVYYDAALRHLTAFWEGEDIDPDSNLPHIVKAMACLAVLRDSQLIGNVVDDRPPSHTSGWQKELNKKASELIEKYPNPKEAFTIQRCRCGKNNRCECESSKTTSTDSDDYVQPYGNRLLDAIAGCSPSDNVLRVRDC